MTAFEEFGVMPEIGKAVEDMEWNLPTDVQEGYSIMNVYFNIRFDLVYSLKMYLRVTILGALHGGNVYH